MLKYFLYYSLFLLLANPVLANNAIEINLNVSVDKVVVGETFQVSVLIKNASTDNLSIRNLKIPGINNFKQVGSSQSTKIQIINGVTTAVNETTLNLMANKEGIYEIGPVEIKANGQSGKSGVVNIVVEKAEKKSFFNTSDKKRANISSGSGIENVNKSFGKFTDFLFDFLALALLIFLIYIFNKQKKQKKARISEDNYKKEKIEISKLIVIPNYDDDKFYEKIKTSILLFIFEKFSIDTGGLTSQELIKVLQKENVYNFDEIERALSLCDQGRFAKNSSIKNDLIEIIKKIYGKTN